MRIDEVYRHNYGWIILTGIALALLWFALHDELEAHVDLIDPTLAFENMKKEYDKEFQVPPMPEDPPEETAPETCIDVTWEQISIQNPDGSVKYVWWNGKEIIWE